MAESLGLASLFCCDLELSVVGVVSSKLNKCSPTSDAHSLEIRQQELAAECSGVSRTFLLP